VKTLLERITAAAESKKALDIVVLNVRRTSACLDQLVVMTVESRPQLKAVAGEIEAKIKENVRWEGEIESGWIILYLGSIVVHVMEPEARAYYNLEGLWGSEAVVYHI
jgi:ribosome-associated protein